MNRYRLALLILGALLPALCQAQGTWNMRGANTRALQLFDDITLLQRIVPLQLTDAQLDAALKLYEQHPLDVAPDPEEAAAIQKLEEMKQRLLAGTALVATDQNALRELVRQTMRGRGRRADGTPAAPGTPAVAAPEPLSPLEEAVWDLLSQTQKAALLGDIRQAAANNQKADQVLGQRVIQTVGGMLKLEDPQWLAARDRLATALAAPAGAADSPARNNCRQLFVDFLDRVRKMPQPDFTTRQDELAAELLALVPPGASLIVALAEYDTGLIHSALGGSFLNPRVPALLAEMKAARAK